MSLHPRWLIVGILVLLASIASRPGLRASERSDHWAFIPPSRPEIPGVGDPSWSRNPIDRFVLAELEAFELRPAPEADRTSLLRRLSFDLTGLPPAPEEIDAFLEDDGPQAYERQVERLLASPHYGERMAQHWLDLARYADSDGFEFDEARPDMWRYRDWVVGSFNRDLPYDQFLALQMAGDEIAPDDPSAAVATGFHRCYPDMVDMNDQGERRQIALDDITETTGLVFLGLTIGCARCHDHKFDPITQVDFFRLQSFFTPSRFDDGFVIASEEQRSAFESEMRTWRAEVAGVQAALIRLELRARDRLAPGLPPEMTGATRAAFETAEEARTPEEVGLVFEAIANEGTISREQLEVALGPDGSADRDALHAQLIALESAMPPALPQARVLVETSPESPPTYLLIRGQYGRNGPELTPGFPDVLTTNTDRPEIRPGVRSTGRRAALASWLTTPNHPLTARVIVNRLWQLHFGRGIVATPSDFGTMGIAPSHPELLDWLATELPTRGWSLKELQRLIVTSATYRMSTHFDPGAAGLDPENELFWRQGRRRLDGEAIRDALLASSGLLNPERGGPPIFPELPEELTKLSSKGAIWPVSERLEDRHRRSLYVFVRRNLRFPFFEAFDRPDTNASCPQRPVTLIAPQALALLNDRLVHDAASALADRVSREAGPEIGPRVERAFLLVLGRCPSEDEQHLAVEFLREGTVGGWQSFCLALFNTNEFVYLD